MSSHRLRRFYCLQKGRGNEVFCGNQTAARTETDGRQQVEVAEEGVAQEAVVHDRHKRGHDEHHDARVVIAPDLLQAQPRHGQQRDFNVLSGGKGRSFFSVYLGFRVYLGFIVRDLDVFEAEVAEEVAHGAGGQAGHGAGREDVDGPALGGPLQVDDGRQSVADGRLQAPQVRPLVLQQPARHMRILCYLGFNRTPWSHRQTPVK